MKMEVDRQIMSSKKELLKITVEFDPSNIDEEGLVAIVATVADLAVRHIELKESKS